MTDGTGKPRSPSYVQRLLGQVFGRWTARLGLAWIAILVIAAVFAPLLASSHPLLLETADGTLESPFLEHLAAGDVILFGVFLAGGLILPWRGGSLRRRLALWIGASAVATGLALAFVQPPALTIHSEYRAAEARGEYAWVIRAPIPYSPKDYLRDRGDTGLVAPLGQATEGRHWMGTDKNGADVASRMIHASRIALGIGFVATGIALIIGVIIGGLMGYFAGLVDILGMRLVEIFEAVPVLFLLLTFVAFFGRNIYLMMVIIGITAWPAYARYIRAEFLRLREQEFVQAAIACGLPLRSILFRHMLPNGVAPLLVTASFGVASAILAETTLSFLGVGLVDDPSWGQILNQAVQSSDFYWWLAAFPGGAIFLTVFSYNLIGEALRDAIDPHLRSRPQ